MKTDDKSMAKEHLDPLPEPLLYDLKQAAAALNMSTKSVRRLLWRGKLTCLKAVRKILIPRKQIEDFLKANCDVPNFNS
jgi:excisionase family DNA binding protein